MCVFTGDVAARVLSHFNAWLPIVKGKFYRRPSERALSRFMTGGALAPELICLSVRGLKRQEIETIFLLLRKNFEPR
jgi:hypothetical protein